MNILIPMAGEGSRFKKNGYKTSKPLIPTTNWRNGKKIPMVVAAAFDIPQFNTGNFIFALRTHHLDVETDKEILKYIPNSKFIEIKELTEGQASTCLLTEDLINNDEELLIAGCDNGMLYSNEKFVEAKNDADAIIFTFRSYEHVKENPNAYGWVEIEDGTDVARGISVKKSISDNPLNDHAITSAFWFRKGCDFVKYTEEMIKNNDRINNEFYVDKCLEYFINSDHKVKVFEIDRYLGWGTPQDYECYENSFNYWMNFNLKREMK